MGEIESEEQTRRLSKDQNEYQKAIVMQKSKIIFVNIQYK